LGLTAADATMLIADGQLQVSQVVDPLKTARYAMPVEILAQFGRRLSSDPPSLVDRRGRRL
jgi:hypothetical protein